MAESGSQFKAKGDQAFVDGKLLQAVGFYSQAIDLDPQNAMLLANRGQLCLMLTDFTNAVKDTNAAIAIDPTLAIAYYRKASALSKATPTTE